MKHQLSPFQDFLRFTTAILLLASAFLIACALWAPDHENGISLWWALAAIGCAVQGSLMMRAILNEEDTQGGQR